MISRLDLPEIAELDVRARPVTQADVDEGFTHWLRDMSTNTHRLLVLLVIALFTLPGFWMIASALRQVGLPPPSQLEWIPNPITFDNYVKVLDGSLIPFGLYLVNSLKVVAVAVPATIITASMAGFAMAQIAPAPRAWLMVISIATLMVPVTALWLTRFVIYKWIGVIDSLWAVILPAFMGSSPFYVLLFYWTFSRIPSELYEAARLEGASAPRVWASIAIPMSKPAVVAVGVLAFVLYWSNFIDPLLYLNNQENYTLPIGLQALQQLVPTDFPLLMAGSVLITVPVVIMFMFAQRWFLEDARGAGWIGR
ncbi:MAG TPA: carbohydrate ABC transporter permease [Chloroflexia bacterium]|nr:carbohydrate ABC transporter permease [Chloroflexia bacterium]